MRTAWRRLSWLERSIVVLGTVTVVTNLVAAFLPPRELWRLLVAGAWAVTVPYVLLCASYRELVDQAQALTRATQAMNAELLAELTKRDEPWRLS